MRRGVLNGAGGVRQPKGGLRCVVSCGWSNCLDLNGLIHHAWQAAARGQRGRAEMRSDGERRSWSPMVLSSGLCQRLQSVLVITWARGPATQFRWRPDLAELHRGEPAAADEPRPLVSAAPCWSATVRFEAESHGNRAKRAAKVSSHGAARTCTLYIIERGAAMRSDGERRSWSPMVLSSGLCQRLQSVLVITWARVRHTAAAAPPRRPPRLAPM